VEEEGGGEEEGDEDEEDADEGGCCRLSSTSANNSVSTAAEIPDMPSLVYRATKRSGAWHGGTRAIIAHVTRWFGVGRHTKQKRNDTHMIFTSGNLPL
jgi:hypothetical protein